MEDAFSVTYWLPCSCNELLVVCLAFPVFVLFASPARNWNNVIGTSVLCVSFTFTVSLMPSCSDRTIVPFSATPVEFENWLKDRVELENWLNEIVEFENWLKDRVELELVPLLHSPEDWHMADASLADSPRAADKIEA